MQLKNAVDVEIMEPWLPNWHQLHSFCDNSSIQGLRGL